MQKEMTFVFDSTKILCVSYGCKTRSKSIC